MTTTTTTAEQREILPCFECEGGILRPVADTYTSQHPKLGKVSLPDISMFRCDCCGDTVLGDEGNRQIDAWFDKALNAISPEEIQSFLSKYGLTQKEASRITGLGEKNISRWASGRARPSESVSNLLRLLLADASSFERLKQKNFVDRNLPSYPVEERQPNEEEKEVLRCIDFPKLIEMGLCLEKRSPMDRRTQLCKMAQCSDLLEFRSIMEQSFEKMAAFKDTRQKSNVLSGGFWVWLGEQAARKITVAPYSRNKLRDTVRELRELTVHPLESIASEVPLILARAGVALVFIPPMKQAALRGCTRLLTPNKAMIIHSLKYRTISQFWIILFHEIAHLLLHISKAGEAFTDYEEQSSDPKETDADNWAYDTLVSLDRELELKSDAPVPEPWRVARFAKEIGVHPAIVAEVFNKRAGKEIISYAYMKKENLFPHLSETEAAALMATVSTEIR